MSDDAPCVYTMKTPLLSGFIILAFFPVMLSAQITETKITPSDPWTSDWFGRSVSISGDYTVVGAQYDDDNGEDSGSGYVFKREGPGWVEQAKLTASDGAAGDYFGISVSISGTYTVIGAWGDDDNGILSGSAYIFGRVGTSWDEEVKLTPSDGAASDKFGASVSISGEYVMVGAPFSAGDSGSVYVYRREGTSWVEEGKLTASDGAKFDAFGNSVSISGDHAIIGAPYSGEGETGSAYVFKRQGTSWVEEAKLIPSDGAGGEDFGSSVSISEDRAVIGAYGDDDNGPNSGSAYIFAREGSDWFEVSKLIADDGASFDYFGLSVAISGDHAIVGAYGDNDNGISSGSAYLFKSEGANWVKEAKLTASDGQELDKFGYSVGISGDYTIIGAYDDDNYFYSSGSAYVYFVPSISVGLTLSPSSGDGTFEYTVDFTNNTDSTLTVDIWTEMSGPGEVTKVGRVITDRTLEGNHSYSETKTAGLGEGAPLGNYLFTVNVGEYPGEVNFGASAAFTKTKPGETKLTASDGQADDRFGWSVSISGDYAIIGISRSEPGSAYVFRREEANWTEEAKLVASDGAQYDWFGNSVSISGDCAVVGAFAVNSAYVFRREGASWVEEAKLRGAGGEFGTSVSISGDRVVVGARRDDNSGTKTGAAYVYRNEGTLWTQEAMLTASDGSAFDEFGGAVAISGDNVIVGAALDDDQGPNSGSAYIFSYDGTNWVQEAKLMPGDGEADEFFGISSSISGDHAVIGAFGDDDNGVYSGSAYVFRRAGTSWIEEEKLTHSNGAGGDYFGRSVSISGDYVVVGSDLDDGSAIDQGSAHVFKREETGWNQTSELIAADAAEGARFGYSVAISGDDVVAGAMGDNANGNSSGSAYVYSGISTPTTLGKGEGSMTEVVLTRFELFQNHPNPFNPSTTITYALKEDANITLRVYNMLGQLVATLVDQEQTTGYKWVVWNGRNDAGASVASGIYVYTLTANDVVITRKFVLLR